MNLSNLTCEKYGKDLEQCTNQEIYDVLLEFVQKLGKGRASGQEKKRLYYISAEFLMGKMLSNNLINLELYEEVEQQLRTAGKSMTEIEELEPEPSLGNGGLGRLAACFLDSAATLGLPADGIGLNYHLGLFRQKFQNLKQTEEPNPWIEQGRNWLTDTGLKYKVDFGTCSVIGHQYDFPIIGYENRTNELHLFDLETVDESIVKDSIAFDKTQIEKNLTLFLYPDDSERNGQILRVYQQYFMVSCGAQMILQDCMKRGSNLHDLPEYGVIQINDTHPSMVIPELIRLLGLHQIEIDEAIQIVSSMCAYTNHTILAEALEKWPVEFLQTAVPQIMEIILKLDQRVRDRFQDETVYLIDQNNQVNMANMDIHYGFSVNGVAKLHTEILKENTLHNFYLIYPEKFQNKTNGITFRRWLMYCNRGLASYLDSIIGEDYKADAFGLEHLLKYKEETQVLHTLLEIKEANKAELADYIFKTQGIILNPDSIYDIQIKRLHEYKRQQMNALYVIHKYLEIKRGNLPKRPITIIFGAKAAPAYTIAKDIIHLILCLQKLVNEDRKVNPYLNVVMVENYNVTLAEKLIPACDISEQISLASKEASGTGNMKFMLNGAVTLGTMDGANVEIAQLVGPDNIYIFGESSNQVISHYQKADYSSRRKYEESKEIKEALDFIVGPELTQIGDSESLNRLYQELLGKDWFMTLLDYQSYRQVKETMYEDYEDRNTWAQKMLVNIAKAGYFSSDRTVQEYNQDIWKLK